MSEVIEIEAGRYSLDWVDFKKHKIELDKVIGIKIHYRGGNEWHVEVVTKQRMNRCKDKTCIFGEHYYSYELDHWVTPREVKQILKNGKVKIMEFTNMHNHQSFIQRLTEILTP